MRDHAQRLAATRRIMLIVVAVALLTPVQTAPAKNFLWKATGKGNSVYLAGSIHMLSPDFYPLHPAFEAAFNDSDLLVEEVDMAEMLGTEAQMQALMRGMLPPGQTLDKVLSPATLALVTKTAKDLNAPLEALQRFKPWMLALTLEGLQLASAGF